MKILFRITGKQSRQEARINLSRGTRSRQVSSKLGRGDIIQRVLKSVSQ